MAIAFSTRRTGAVLFGLVLATAVVPVAPAAAQAPMVQAQGDLKTFNVTVRRFDPAKGLSAGTDFVLPVDSPDEEHACASTLANAASFSRKIEGGHVLPVAFACTAVARR